MAAGCNAEGVCGHKVESEGMTAPVIVQPDQAVSFDVQGNGAGVQMILRVDTSNMRDAARVRATAQIIDIATGEVVSHVIMANTEGD